MSPVEELLHKLVKAPVILLVTENHQEAIRLGELLDKFHCHTIPTCDIEEAIDVVRGRAVDMILVDNRIDCEREARLLGAALMENPSMPVVVLTGYGDDEIPTKAANHGFVGLFPRPGTTRDFEQLFRSLKLKVRPCPEAAESRAESGYVSSATT